MTDKTKAFLNEVRNMPGFVSALATDSKWLRELEGIERGLLAVDRLADEGPIFLEIFDKIEAVIGRADLSTKARLLEIGKLLVQVRDAMKIIH